MQYVLIRKENLKKTAQSKLIIYLAHLKYKKTVIWNYQLII